MIRELPRVMVSGKVYFQDDRLNELRNIHNPHDRIRPIGNAMARKIAMRNDRLRSRIPCIAKPDMLVITRGIAALGDEAVTYILTKVKMFSDFNEDNNPWGERDFGSIEYEGKKVFFKIDDYAGHEGYELVLTVLLASEY